VLFSTTLLSVVNYYCTVSHSPGSYQPEPLSYKAHWENTFIPASRAMSDYLLDLEDLQDLSQKKVRSADIDSEKSILCYLKSDVEKR